MQVLGSGYFTNLPDGAICILEDANGRPTLVEYALGDGFVIASGLTWEYTYVRDFVLGTSFAKSVYDDLIVHAVSLSDPCEHVFGITAVVAPTCTEKGYTAHTCVNCGVIVRFDFVDAHGHTIGDWVIIENATAYSTGYKQKLCTSCGEALATEIIPVIDGQSVRVEADRDIVLVGDEITFNIVIAGFDPVKALAIVPQFDTDVFEFVYATWNIEAHIQSIEEGTLRSASAWDTFTDVNCSIYTITLRAKAPADITSVSCLLMYQEGTGRYEAPVVANTLSVIDCPHASMTYTDFGDAHHVHICDRCGFTELLEGQLLCLYRCL